MEESHVPPSPQETPQGSIPAPQVVQNRTFPKKLLIAFVVVLLGLLGGVIFFAQTVGQSLVVAPSPSPTPLTRQSRTLSPLATESAFIRLDASVTSAAAALSSLTIEDPSLAPPKLDLPLGLTK